MSDVEVRVNGQRPIEGICARGHVLMRAQGTESTPCQIRELDPTGTVTTCEAPWSHTFQNSTEFPDTSFVALLADRIRVLQIELDVLQGLHCGKTDRVCGACIRCALRGEHVQYNEEQLDLTLDRILDTADPLVHRGDFDGARRWLEGVDLSALPAVIVICYLSATTAFRRMAFRKEFFDRARKRLEELDPSRADKLLAYLG